MNSYAYQSVLNEGLPHLYGRHSELVHDGRCTLPALDVNQIISGNKEDMLHIRLASTVSRFEHHREQVVSTETKCFPWISTFITYSPYIGHVK